MFVSLGGSWRERCRCGASSNTKSAAPRTTSHSRRRCAAWSRAHNWEESSALPLHPLSVWCGFPPASAAVCGTSSVSQCWHQLSRVSHEAEYVGATLTLAIIPSHTLTLPIIPSVGLDSVPLLVGSMCVEDRAALAPKLEARRYADQEVIVAAGDWVR